MKLLRNLLFICCFSVLTTSCVKKLIDETTNDLFVNIMTDGQWKVTNYMEGTTDLTTDYDGWAMKFYSNNTSTSTKGSTIINGTWSGGLATNKMTVNASSAIYPIDKLVGTWDIISGTLTVGKFSQNRNGVILKLELTKF
jgi:hypothetical protein